MNNSRLAIEHISLTEEETVDRTPYLSEREGQLVSIIEALRTIQSLKEWSTLKINVFDSLASKLEKELTSEAKKDSPDAHKLRYLSGQLKWAEKYADLSKLEGEFRTELTQVRQHLYGKT